MLLKFTHSILKHTLDKSILIKTPYLHSSFLLKNGRVVNSDLSETKDVLIQGQIIQNVGNNLIVPPNTKIIDCKNKLIIPGGIDTHCHMQLPFMGAASVDDFNIGSKAAIAGGTTCFIDFVMPSKGETLSKAYQRWRGWADGKVNCDYALHCSITQWTQQTANQMKKMVSEGISSFKFFMAYNGSLRLQDQGMMNAFEIARQLGAICLVHAENGDIIAANQQKLTKLGILGPQGHYLSRPASIQAQAVHRVITIAQQANCPVYIVHVMSKQASEQVQRAKNKGSLVYSETLAASLGVDGRMLWNKDWDVASRYVMSPPLNPDPTVKTHLMKMIQSKVIDVVGTDNCTFCTQQKRIGKDTFTKIPNGVNGLEDRLSIVWTKGVRKGLLSENDFVNAVSTQAAKLFNLYPRKGLIRAGSDADVVVWDPEQRHIISKDTHHHKVDYNIFEGMQVFGKANYSFSRGRLVWDGKQFMNQGKGQYLKRESFGTVYNRHKYWSIDNDPLKYKVDRSGTASNFEQKNNQQLIEQMQRLRAQLNRITQERDNYKKQIQNNVNSNNLIDTKSFYDKNGEFVGLQEALNKFVPTPIRDDITRILYGKKWQEHQLRQSVARWSEKNNVQIKKYSLKAQHQQNRQPRIVKIGSIQNKIVLPTTQPVKAQKYAILDRIGSIIQQASKQQVNIICLQQIWNAPFFMCTRQRYPWVQFSEPANGQTTQFLKNLAKKYNMVIVSSILQRNPLKGTLHNTAVILDNQGDILGKQEKGHIPRVGDFNQSTYYLEGLSGHPVFDTAFGKIAVNICYGRHHPLHWMGFGLNGAQIVFNPSATVGGLSEHLWGIEARNAAIANHYFTVGINRVGTQIYPNAFTSGDGKPAHNDFGHFYGSSYVTAPDGSRTPSLCRNRDGLLITEVDLNMCQQIKDKWMFTYTARFELYAQLLKEYVKQGYVPQVVSKNAKV